MSDRRQAMISDAAIYSSLAIATQLLTLVTGILTRKFLGPVQMGVWSLLQIILVYSAYSTFGVTESISREIPLYRSKGEDEKAEFLKNVIVTFSILTSALVSVGILVWLCFFHSRINTELAIGLLIMTGMILLQRVSNLHIAFLRAYKHFQFAGKQMVMSSLVNSILVIYFTHQYSMHGFMWAMCFSFVFNIFWIRLWHPFSFQWKLDWKQIWELMKYGFPLMISGFLGSLFMSIDKIMIAKFLGLRELGLYSLATMAYTYICNIPNSIGIVLIPNFHEKFGEDENPEAMRGYLMKSAQGFSDLMPILIAGILCFGPYLARKVLPDFNESIPPMQVLVMSAYFLSLITPFDYFLAVIRKQAIIVPIVVASCFMAFLFNYIAIRGSYGLLGVSFATVLVFIVKFTAVFFVAMPKIFSMTDTWKAYAVFMGKFVYLFAVALLLDRLLPNEQGSFFLAMIQFGVFLLAFSPFLLKLNNDLKVIDSLKKKFPFLSREPKKNEVDG